MLDETLTIRGLIKTFGTTRALDSVDLTVHRGEVHALLGQNGSGKSTLIKVLAGYHQPEPGWTCTTAGQQLALGSAEAAKAAGIRFIHQDLGLVGELDVVDNLALGPGYSGRWWVSHRQEQRRAVRLLAEFGIRIDVTSPVGGLSPAQQSMLAIAKAVHGMPPGGLLVLDEPTAALPQAEVGRLFSLIEQLRSRGVTILYVTHRLGEVFEIADRVTVLRDGRRVATRPISEVDHDSLVELIVGRAVDSSTSNDLALGAEEVLVATGLRGGTVRDASLTLRRGEILGVTGLVGSGFEDLGALMFGGLAREAGDVRIGGNVLAPSPSAAIAAGVAFAPADRRRLGAMLSWTVRENITLPAIPSRGLGRWMSASAERTDVADWIRRADVRPEDPETRFSALSGGNQQKALIARWLRCGAQVFLLDEPTNGVDVGAKRGIYDALFALVATGAAVLMSSSDAEELCAVCDRVLVMRNGHVVTVLQGSQLTVDRLNTETVSVDRETRYHEGETRAS